MTVKAHRPESLSQEERDEKLQVCKGIMPLSSTPSVIRVPVELWDVVRFLLPCAEQSSSTGS